MDSLTFVKSLSLEILIPLCIIFVALCIISAIFMAAYNKVMLLYDKDRKEMDFWTSMCMIILLFIIGMLLFKPEYPSITKIFNY